MTDITSTHLDAAILDQKVAGEFAGKSYAFVAITTKSLGGWGLGVAVKDENGYSPISGKEFHTHGEAKQWADGLNEHIGLSKDAALDIVSSTMFGRGKRVGG